MSHSPRTFVWGFPQEFGKIIAHARRENVIDDVLWVGPDPHCTYSRKDFMMPDLSFKYASPVRCPVELYQAVREKLWTYMDMASRWNRMWPNIFPYDEYDIHDFLNLFSRQLDFYYHLLTTHQVELVLFDRIPHYGTDKILYELAQAMGVKTLVFFVTVFPDRFFYLYDVADFGYFRQIPALYPYEHLTIEKKYEKHLPYMVTMPTNQYTLVEAISHGWKTRRLSPFLKYRRYQQYLKNLKRYTTQDFNLQDPYVYFPLHYQPELTTSALGDIYCDQLLALEHLSDMLPDDWSILVKDNPAQSEFMRGRPFFERLSVIPKVKLVPRNMSTYHLIEQARFIATVTGTAGWEAITGGKNALIFGQAWYMNFPGVFRFQDQPTVAEILAYRIDHEALEQAYSRLMTYVSKGEIGRENYHVIDFDADENGAKIASAMATMVQGLYAPVGAERP